VSQAITEYNASKFIEDEDEIDLRQLWSVITRNKWSITWLAVTFTILAVIILFSITPIYKANYNYA